MLINKKLNLFIIGGLTIAILLSAQTFLGSTFSVNAQDQIFQKTPLTDQRLELKERYRNYVESYRLAEQEFVVAKSQFQQLSTLNSLENAVQKTKAVLLTRNNVLETYLELVQITLLDTPGTNLDDQQVISDELTNTIQELQSYRQKLEESNDRDSVNLRSDEFDLISPKVISIAHKGMALIMISKVQNVYDISKLLHQDLIATQQQNQVSTLRQQEIDRANQEIVRTLDQVLSQLGLVNAHLERNLDKDVNPNYYQQVQQLLSPAYSNLSQVVSFLAESI